MHQNAIVFRSAFASEIIAGVYKLLLSLGAGFSGSNIIGFTYDEFLVMNHV